MLFIGNTAVNAGGAIANSESGSTNASYNWWGSNNGPASGQIYGSVNYTPWLCMNVTAVPRTIPYNGSSTVTVSFNKDSNGNSTSGVCIPDGTIVTFNSTSGTFNHSTATTTNGTANVTFTGTSLGTCILTYKLSNNGPDNATNVTVSFPDTSWIGILSLPVLIVEAWTYNATTRMLTWTLDSVPVGDSISQYHSYTVIGRKLHYNTNNNIFNSKPEHKRATINNSQRTNTKQQQSN